VRVSSGVVSVPVSSHEFIVVNTYTGAVDLVDQDVITLLEEIAKRGGIPLSESDKSALKTLITRGYVTDISIEDEINTLEELFQRSFKATQRCKLHRIIVTYDCDLRCKYCYEMHLRKRSLPWLRKTLTENEIDLLFDAVSYLDSNCDMKYRMITLYGGEPFLPQNIEIVKYLMRKGMKRGYRFFAVTNGVSLKDYASELKKEGLDGVQITLDGLREVHDKRRFKADGTGTFDEIVQSIEEARKVGFETISLRLMVDRENVDKINDLVNFVIDKGWNQDKRIMTHLANVFKNSHFDYSPSIPWEEGVINIINILSQNESLHFLIKSVIKSNPIGTLFMTGEWLPKFFYCDANCNQFFYDSHGDIYTCWKAVGKGEQAVGRFLPALRFDARYRAWIQRNVLSMPTCRTCRYLTLCGGGCTIEAYEKTGSIMSPNCMGIRDFFDRYVSSIYRLSKRK